MGRYWLMIARAAWRENLTEVRRVTSTTSAALAGAAISIALGIGNGAPSTGVMGAAAILLVRYLWSVFAIPAKLHYAQETAKRRKEAGAELEALFYDGKRLLRDSAAGSYAWFVQCELWSDSVESYLASYDDSERVMFKTFAFQQKPTAGIGTNEYASQVQALHAARLEKLRLIMGRAYSTTPAAVN